MNELDYTNLTISHAATLIQSGQLSPRELTEACLSRIERLNPRLNAFLTVLTTEALQEAQQASDALARGEHWGPLHGIPIAVKDLIDVAGVRTTAGSQFLKDNIPEHDAAVVRQLRAAGAIIIGKTHLHEYAIGATNVNPHYGPARNPWNVEMIPGGSSGGSAAAVAGLLCPGALGTDTGGSVRLPAALCNLTGLRPGKGRVSTQGVIPMSWTLDSVGPMARSAEDVGILLDAMDDQPIRPALCTQKIHDPVMGLRVGVPIDDFIWRETSHQVVGAVHGAIETFADLGIIPVDVRLPQIQQVLRAASVISLADAAAYHAERLASEPERFGADVRARLEWGQRRSAVDYAQARQTGREWQADLQALFREEIDMLVLPTSPVTALPIEGNESLSAAKELLRFTYPFSLSGLPSLSMPCGFTEDRMPVGVQLIGLGEAMLVRVAHAYQQKTNWHTITPEF